MTFLVFTSSGEQRSLFLCCFVVVVVHVVFAVVIGIILVVIIVVEVVWMQMYHHDSVVHLLTLEIGKTLNFSQFKVSDSDGRTDGRTDKPSYRDARTHLKTLMEYALVKP